MYSRLVPWDAFSCEKSCSLPSDTHRLVYLALWLAVDDFGNLAARTNVLYRWASLFSQLRDKNCLERLISDLGEAGLLRTYQVGGQSYLNLPGFRSSRTYIQRNAPPSPWCDPNAYTGPYKASSMRIKRTARVAGRGVDSIPMKINSVAAKSDSEIGNEVGVEKGESKWGPGVPVPTSFPKDWSLPDEWRIWALVYVRSIGSPVRGKQVLELAKSFREHWQKKRGARARRVDWFAQWREWFCNSDVVRKRNPPPSS